MTIRITTSTVFTLIGFAIQIPMVFAQPASTDSVSNMTGRAETLGKNVQISLSDNVVYSPLGRPFVPQETDSPTNSSPLLTFKTKPKEPVYCLLDGIVAKAGSQDACSGNDIEIYHPYPGLSTITSNLGSLCVKSGEQLSRGNLLGYSKDKEPDSSTSIGFAVMDGSTYIKPTSFLNQVNQYVLKLHDSKKEATRSGETRDLEFLSSANINFQRSNVAQVTPSSWTALERQTVSNLLEWVRYSFPQFIHLARTSGHLKLLRVREILLTNGQTATAVTCKEFIVLSDKFFNETRNQFHCLCHELVHSADRYGFISYSKEWIDFAQPLIAEYKKDSTKERFTRWPGDYACTNSIEALAEYTSDYIAGKYYPSKSAFDTNIRTTIFSPSQKQLKWCELVELGDTQLTNEKLDESESLLKQAVKLFPEKPLPYHFLAVARAKQGDVAGAIGYSNRFLSTLSDLKLDNANLIKSRYSHSLFENYRTKNANTTSARLLDHFCQKLPDDAGFAKIRSKMKKTDIHR